MPSSHLKGKSPLVRCFLPQPQRHQGMFHILACSCQLLRLFAVADVFAWTSFLGNFCNHFTMTPQPAQAVQRQGHWMQCVPSNTGLLPALLQHTHLTPCVQVSPRLPAKPSPEHSLMHNLFYCCYPKAAGSTEPLL